MQHFLNELELVRGSYVLLVAAVNEYYAQVKNFEKKLDEKALNGKTLLRKLKQSKHESDRLEYEKKLLRQKREEVQDSSVREAGTFPRYFKRLLEALKTQYVRLAMSVTQSFRVWRGRKVSALDHLSVESI